MTPYEKHIARVFLCLGAALGGTFVGFLTTIVWALQ